MKPSLVLLHGWSIDSRVWGDLRSALSGSIDIITPDLPGHGHEAAVEGVVDAVEHVRRLSRTSSAAVIVGWSEAAAVACDVAAALPEARVVVVCAGEQHVDGAAEAKARGQLVGDYPRAARSRVRASTSKATSLETEEWLFAMSCGSSLDAQLAALSEPLRPPLPHDAISVTGEFDAIIAPGGRLQATTDITLPCGHTPHIELVDQFTTIMCDVITGRK